MTYGRLVVPEGLVIDEVARERLARQLKRQPRAVLGVAGEVGELAPGSSYRVHAEWRSLEPWSAFSTSTAAVRGAVLLRPDARFEVVDGLVAVDGPIVVDRGAHVHDPWAAIGLLHDASERGRPPFPRRPVVVFAATETDSARAEWARGMVNRLVRREVEARLAFPSVAEAPSIADVLHLTRPCLVGSSSIQALAADVIVALDGGAAENAAQWCGPNRATVVVELVDELDITVRMVSWQIARARGRVRAQISRRVGAPSLASLVVRLSSGPQPVPPSDAAADEADSRRVVRENWGAAGSVARPTCVMLTGSMSVGTEARLTGLVDHLEVAGIAATPLAVEREIPAHARAASLVILVGVDRSPALVELIAERTAQRRPTVLDVDVASFDAGFEAGAGVDSALVAAAPAAQLAIDCGNAMTPTEVGRSALRRAGVRSLAVPTMLTRARAKELRAAAKEVSSRRGASLGWHLGGTGEPVPAYVDAVGEGIAKLLTDRVDLRVEIVGHPDRVPSALRRNDRVSVHSEIAPEALAGWELQVWTPRILGAEMIDDLRALIEASAAAVPTVLPGAARRSMDGFAGNEVVVQAVDESQDWTVVLRALLGDDRLRKRLGAAAWRWAHAVHGPSACRTSVNRLLGWALYEEQP